MSFITSLTRMWLTRRWRPFEFKNEYDEILPYQECDNLGLYIHIPFCKSICNFCPYCKTLYSPELCNEYIDALIKEISLVGGQSKEKKRVSSLYFGGGTPALIADRIADIVTTVSEHFIITEGIGVELHPDNINLETLNVLKKAGVTKISIGIQSFSEKYAKILGRKAIDTKKIADVISMVEFETVSMDFIFALPDQTYNDLKSDIDTAFAIGANHIAIYPFIDFSFTESTLESMKKGEKRRLLDSITKYCLDRGYSRSSIWTFSSEKQASYSSMTRESFLGFGCSATSLLRDQFKINTFDVRSYCERIRKDSLPTSLTIRFTPRQRMIYWLFWTAYSTKVNEDDFEKFFGVSLKKAYGFELMIARLLGFVNKRKNIYEMTLKGAFYYHYYENFYTLSYIDKMWGIMRKEAFPKRIDL